jgi:hypothetical protein
MRPLYKSALFNGYKLASSRLLFQERLYAAAHRLTSLRISSICSVTSPY